MDTEPLRICVSLCERSRAALAKAVAGAAAEADLIEVRLDCLDGEDLKSSCEQISQLLSNFSASGIFTLRPTEQGGASLANFKTRLKFWSDQIPTLPHLCDLEIDIVERLAAEHIEIDWSRVICSHHDFSSGSIETAALEQLYDRLSATPAGILKIALRADDALECLPVFNLLERGRQAGRSMIAIAMGTAGLATRILGPSRGAFLTYASADKETATAPGQITARELREVYRIEKIDQQTKIFGLVGSPVAHSVSPQMHNAAFAAANMNAVYVPFEVTDLKGFLRRMIHPRTRELDWKMGGLSVTAPHKFEVMEQLDWIDSAARQIGAVNTVVVTGDRLLGYNTDAIGFLKPLAEKVGLLRGARCAVIGAGGAASAAVWVLKQEGADVVVYAREAAKARALSEKFGVNWESLEDATFAGFDVVINATPLGTKGEFESQTPAKTEQLRGARLAYDLVYNPTDTRYLLEAREAGCDTLGGLQMLVAQAAEQFNLWTGEDAPEAVMYTAAQPGLGQAK